MINDYYWNYDIFTKEINIYQYCQSQALLDHAVD